MTPSPSIRHAVLDGAVVILDLCGGSYAVLDRVASDMWSVLVDDELDDDARARAVVSRFDAPPELVRRDLDAFRQDCLEKGFLLREPVAPDERTTRLPAVIVPTVSAWLCLLRTVRALARRGFAATYRSYASLAAPPAPRDDEERIVRSALGAFSAAESFFMLRRAPRDCLPRSLALFRFMRAMRLPAAHCIGVQRYPFQAHAWVEYRGRVVLDPDKRSRFTVLARIGA